ncbi:MAG: hypothetical protein A2381_03010 [Bdellovibrionales bacterium RIFOXYB1_FULL_37_110]|nr:MAG: hypothetical protein A2181_03390 [Bdellovibrionales bacterium RIFOXYA1_FULL_38_20]OFZ51476.1 MAG: hypothetical protein A2417_09465 [Bdellovibrionales bacterium RIFOXYC1_FULL_37_79]OFZ57904.1 MAG: hypothetical protein A2381_03010 [Bdellovibrionales bacterium RIFOXYB1_FULL_37_110]OFZ63630.1 MAG: hypothetical protein A2577_05310 [Bdellovibrionales bacterium RIFOXYD1_FULL_36_51]OFZ66886.1 MAG: hypothetical protein A2328_05365 [Bdellovibrionales bacterium RIFOXYB2_FULL_36_6]OFZ73911.1 MAG: 
MSLKAMIKTEVNGNLTIHMKGGLNFENTEPLKKELATMLSQNPAQNITLDMYGLDFVGSSGISYFVDTIKLLNTEKARIKLKNVKTEFLRVFKLYDFDALSLIEDQFDDDETMELNQKFGNRSKTFQN